MPAHPVEGFRHGARDPEREARDYGAASEHVRVGGEHNRRHGTAGGKTGNEHALRVRTVSSVHRGNHLADRPGLALPSSGIVR